MESVTQKIEAKYKKSQVVNLHSGDTVRVHQKVREGSKERVQIFEGLVIRVSRTGSLSNSFTVRRLASGVGVEKTFLIHSPAILKVEITKRSKVRRNYLTYMRELTGKSTRLAGVDFDKSAVNAVHDEAAEAEEAKIHEEQTAAYDPEAAKKAKAAEKAEAEAAIADQSAGTSGKAEQPKEKTESPSEPQTKAE